MWTSEQGDTRQIGTLTLLANDIVHVDTDWVASTTANALPWYLTPLQAQPMRWRPDAEQGGVPDYAPFEPDPASAAGPAAEPARDFWSRLAAHDGVTRGLRQVAAQMDRRLGGA